MLEQIQYHYKKYSNLLKILFENILTSFLQNFLGEDIKKIIKKNREFLKTVGPFQKINFKKMIKWMLKYLTILIKV